MIPDCCPLCLKDLTQLHQGRIITYQCRHKYIYLGKDNPICHFTFSHHDSWQEENYTTQYRFVLYPFAILTYPKDKKSKVLNLHNRDIRELFWLPETYVNSSNYHEVLNKLKVYVLYQ